MKKLIVFLVCFAVLAAGALAQQTRFMNTIQDFRSRVIDFREDGLTGRFRDGVLVNASPSELEVGDIFIDVDGNAKKVAGVSRVGKEIYIDTVQPRFEEVFLYAEIPDQTISFGPEHLLPDSQTGVVPRASRGAAPRLSTDILNFEHTIWQNPPEAEDPRHSVTISFGLNLEADVDVGFKAPTLVKIKIRSWKFWEWKISFKQESGYISGGLDLDLMLTGAIAYKLQGKLETPEVPLIAFGTPTPGVTATAGIFVRASLEGSIETSLGIELGLDCNPSARCTLQGQVPAMAPTDVSDSGTAQFKVVLKPALAAEVVFRTPLYVKTEVSIVGIKITKFTAGPGFYVRVAGEISGEIGYGTVDGFIHDFNVEGSGELGAYVEVKGEIFNGFWSVTIVNIEVPLVKFFEASNQDDKGRSYAPLPIVWHDPLGVSR